jgi:hypothetical protein
MSDAPEVDPGAPPRLEITPEIFRIYEESLLAGGLELWSLLARHKGMGTRRGAPRCAGSRIGPRPWTRG